MYIEFDSEIFSGGIKAFTFELYSKGTVVSEICSLFYISQDINLKSNPIMVFLF